MNEIETILTILQKCDRSRLYLYKRSSLLDLERLNRLEKILKRRISGEALQYLVGDVEFMGLRLRVKPGVLIPRPETETLVETALARISASKIVMPKILDIGTGSGNIAIAIAKFLTDGRIYAVDISDVCLRVAASNARLHRVRQRIVLRKSDLFSCFKGEKQVFDFIVSNPPYIAPAEYESLPRDVRQEPALALLARDNGLYFYPRIEEGARGYLKPGGVVFLEIGDSMARDLAKIFGDRSVWQEPRFVNDLAGIERVAVIEKV